MIEELIQSQNRNVRPVLQLYDL